MTQVSEFLPAAWSQENLRREKALHSTKFERYQVREFAPLRAAVPEAAKTKAGSRGCVFASVCTCFAHVSYDLAGLPLLVGYGKARADSFLGHFAKLLV